MLWPRVGSPLISRNVKDRIRSQMVSSSKESFRCSSEMLLRRGERSLWVELATGQGQKRGLWRMSGFAPYLSFGSQLNKTVRSRLSRRSFQGMSSSSGLRLMDFILSSKLINLVVQGGTKSGILEQLTAATWKSLFNGHKGELPASFTSVLRQQNLATRFGSSSVRTQTKQSTLEPTIDAVPRLKFCA